MVETIIIGLALYGICHEYKYRKSIDETYRWEYKDFMDDESYYFLKEDEKYWGD